VAAAASMPEPRRAARSDLVLLPPALG